MTIERTWGSSTAEERKPELVRQQAEEAYLKNIEDCIRRYVKKTYPDNQFGRDAWFVGALARRAPSKPESLLAVLRQHDVSIESAMEAIWDVAYQQSPDIFSSDTGDVSEHVNTIGRRVELERTLELLCGYWSAAENEQNEARTQNARAIVDPSRLRRSWGHWGGCRSMLLGEPDPASADDDEYADDPVGPVGGFHRELPMGNRGSIHAAGRIKILRRS
jgi:hypothetical protein